MSACTCVASQKAVDLTQHLLNHSKGIDESASCLRDSLCRYGWCHISLNVDQLQEKKHSFLRRFQKSEFMALFDPNSTMSIVESECILYRDRSAESGSASDAGEPKQSLEAKRSSKTSPLHGWMNAMHTVALTVCRAIQLPSRCLLQESSTRDEYDNIDLLRVFLYDPAHPKLGSSPHTDWGSFTVVWQDTVGGLQTWCPVCKKYTDIDSTHHDPSKVYFVVHVGDVTSLAITHAIKGGESAATTTIPFVSYPSPRHQVTAPREEQRVSLVYFAYPPPSLSMRDIEKRLEESPTWVPPPDGGAAAYASYFLLKNQSPGCQDTDPRLAFDKIRDKPLRDVFEEKWNQVQRDNS